MPQNAPVFTVRETHGRVLRAGNRLIAHSPEIGWRSLYGAVLEEAPFHAIESPIHHPSLIYHLTRPTEVTRQVDGNPQDKALIGPRGICLTPGDATVSWHHSGHPEILQVYLRQSIYASAVSEMYGCDPAAAELIPRFAIQDPLLEQLAAAILKALRNHTAEDGLYIDTLAQMMAVHLARYYSTRSGVMHSVQLPQAGGWRIRRLVEYIGENLEKDLSLETMAQEVDLSPLYLARAFKCAIGKAPHQYVMARRIEQAKLLLRNTDQPIAGIAAATGFSSQSHLSGWFRRQVGLTPAEYRKNGEASVFPIA
jgi:AraC family transcriptional regulator